MKTRKFKIDLYNGYLWKYTVYCKRWIFWVPVYNTDSHHLAVEYVKQASSMPEYYDCKGEKI